MTNEQFKQLVSELRQASMDTLVEKSEKYSKGFDPLHNFRVGAAMTGGTPAQTAWGYMVKHLVALHDKIDLDDFSDRADLLEKCQDIINYVCFVWVMANEGRNQMTIAPECLRFGSLCIDANGVKVDG